MQQFCRSTAAATGLGSSRRSDIVISARYGKRLLATSCHVHSVLLDDYYQTVDTLIGRVRWRPGHQQWWIFNRLRQYFSQLPLHGATRYTLSLHSPPRFPHPHSLVAGRISRIRTARVCEMSEAAWLPRQRPGHGDRGGQTGREGGRMGRAAWSIFSSGGDRSPGGKQ